MESFYDNITISKKFIKSNFIPSNSFQILGDEIWNFTGIKEWVFPSTPTHSIPS